MIALCIFLISQITLEPELHPQFRNKELTVGDPFEITLTISYPSDMQVSEPFVDTLPPFVIIKQSSKSVEEAAIVTRTYEMRMAAFNTGDLKIPSFKVISSSEEGMDTITSSSIPITIVSVLPEDMQDIHDLKEAARFPNFLPLIIAGIIIGAGLLSYIGYRIVKKWIQKKVAVIPPAPPWIEALAAIETIPYQEWIKKGLIKKYYYTLSEILKRYIERRFAFNAMEQTTTEITLSMKSIQVPMREEFSGFFSRADYVKYAKLIPPIEEMHGAVDNARRLVKNTTPSENEVEQ